MKKHHNPNSPWSELPLDLLNSVFERLGFADFQRAKSVCSSWYSASRQAVPNNQIHWLILFPENKHENYYMLLNPEEKEKLYKTKDLGVEFSKSVCIATYGNWLLMHDPLYNLYIMNLFTRERIDLPSVEAQLGTVKVEIIWNSVYRFHISRNMGSEPMFMCKDMDMRFPVFWIDEKTKDYILVWGLDCFCVVYSKKGESSWNQIPKTSHCANMVYKDHKLYFLSWFGYFKIFDFSREIAQQTFQCGIKVERFQLGIEPRLLINSDRFVNIKLVVTVTGKVLEVVKKWRARSNTWSFRIHKIYSSGFLEKPELIKSLGDESMLLDQGITMLVNADTDGFIRNSIYFNVFSHDENTNNIFIFNLETKKTEPLHTFDPSSVQFSRAQWFLPSFTHT